MLLRASIRAGKVRGFHLRRKIRRREVAAKAAVHEYQLLPDLWKAARLARTGFAPLDLGDRGDIGESPVLLARSGKAQFGEPLGGLLAQFRTHTPTGSSRPA